MEVTSQFVPSGHETTFLPPRFECKPEIGWDLRPCRAIRKVSRIVSCGWFLVGKESSRSSRFEYSCARNASLGARVVNLLTPLGIFWMDFRNRPNVPILSLWNLPGLYKPWKRTRSDLMSHACSASRGLKLEEWPAWPSRARVLSKLSWNCEMQWEIHKLSSAPKQDPWCYWELVIVIRQCNDIHPVPYPNLDNQYRRFE